MSRKLLTGITVQDTSAAGVLRIETQAVGAVGLLLKGFLNQTGDYLKIQNSAGADQVRISSGGALFLNGSDGSALQRSNSTSSWIFADQSANQLSILVNGGSGYPILAPASPSIGVLISPAYNFFGVNYAAGNGGSSVGILRANGATSLTVTPYTTTSVGIVAKGTVNQTGNLFQGQDSAGAILTRIGANGGHTIGVNAVTPIPNMLLCDDVTQNSSAGITWYAPNSTGYGIYRTAGAWSAPNYAQLKLSWQTGIQIDPGANQFPLSYVDILNGGLRVSAGNFGMGTTPPFGGGAGVIGIKDAVTLPTGTPVAGGILYSEAGALKWLDSSGAIKVFGAASVVAPLTLSSTAVGMVPFISKGFAGQTADLIQGRDSADVILASLSSAGNLGLGVAAVAANRLTIYAPDNSLAGQSLRIGQSSTADYFIGRSPSSGFLEFSGTQTNYIGYNFTPGNMHVGSLAAASARFQVTNTIVGTPLAILKAANGQTANVLQVRNHLEAVLAIIRNDGLIGAPYFRDPADVGPYLAMTATSINVNSAGAAHNVLVVQPTTGQTGDLTQWRDTTGAIGTRMDKSGYVLLRKTTPAADADIQPSEVNLSWSNIPGAPQLVVKGKASDGVPTAYSPDRLLAIQKYTANSPSQVRTAWTSIGMAVGFHMPALQAGQRVRIEVNAYYYVFASNVGAATSMYNTIDVSGLFISNLFYYVNIAGTIVPFHTSVGYLDNTQKAAGTYLVATAVSVTNSSVAYAFVPEAWISVSIV